MFSARDLDGDLRAVREQHAPGALVLDCERDFETLPARHLDDLATRVDDLDPVSYPREWVPPDAPDLLARVAGPDLVVGLPEHGSVTWTRGTEPPVVLIRPRAQGSPRGFVSFLLAAAFVEIGTGFPEHFLGFLEGGYRDLAALGLDPGDTYQLAAALYAAHVGLHTRETFRGWADDCPRLHDAWRDAGERLEGRIEGVVGEVGRGETSFAAAAELACSGLRHGLDLPAPFDALDTAAYREHGADFALEWAERVLA